MSCDSTHSGDITRDGLYRSLALTAIAQQGRPIEEKSLQHYEDNGVLRGETREGGRGGNGSVGSGGRVGRGEKGGGTLMCDY